MGYRVLVDENTSPRVAELLRGKGHEAVHVHDVLEEGATDRRITEFASANEYLVLTHDDDCLRPEHAVWSESSTTRATGETATISRIESTARVGTSPTHPISHV